MVHVKQGGREGHCTLQDRPELCRPAARTDVSARKSGQDGDGQHGRSGFAAVRYRAGHQHGDGCGRIYGPHVLWASAGDVPWAAPGGGRPGNDEEGRPQPQLGRVGRAVHDHRRLSGKGGSHWYKYRLSDEEHDKILPGAKVWREYLATNAIDAADAIRDVSVQLAARLMDFQGIEWDFLDLRVTRDVRDTIFARFGRKTELQMNLEMLIKPVRPGGGVHARRDFTSAKPEMVRLCGQVYGAWKGDDTVGASEGDVADL
ncbi:hypothetical protein ACJZ2D_016547 [Fusarium nematophilum]